MTLDPVESEIPPGLQVGLRAALAWHSDRSEDDREGHEMPACRHWLLHHPAGGARRAAGLRPAG